MNDVLNNPSALRWLIIGADGLIGRHLFAALHLGGAQVTGTSRRWGSMHTHLDMATDPENWVIPEADVVVIAAAMPRIADCEANEALSHKVNVDAPLNIAKQVWQRGAHVVFLSSSGVFDGVDTVPGIHTPMQPLNVYGQQKMAAELALQAEVSAGEQQGIVRGLSIIRPTKIMGEDTAILREWQAALSEGQTIHPHAWRYMAPLSVTWAVRAIIIIAAASAQGIWHLSAAVDINFAEFARRWAAVKGLPVKLVTPSYQEDSLHARARLDMKETTERFSIVPASIDDTLYALQGSGRS